MRGKKQAVAIECKGKVIRVFGSMAHAAEFLEYSTYRCVQALIDRGGKKGEYHVRFATEEETEQLRKEHKAETKHKENGYGGFIRYELMNGKICITPCPFCDSPKPFVGSALCEKCTSFRWKYRDRQEVKCAIAGRGMRMGLK